MALNDPNKAYVSIRHHLLEDIVTEKMGSNAGQVCTVITNGNKISIEWFGPGHQALASSASQNHRDFLVGHLNYTDNENHYMSILSIKNLTKNHFGKYECRISVDGHARNSYFDVNEKTGSLICFCITFKSL